MKDDGLDHINIYSKGKTSLGRWLSNFARVPILTEDGRFESIEGYWYWLLSIDEDREILRKLYGYKAKEMGKLLVSQELLDNYMTEDFKRKIKSAINIKLYTKLDKFEELKKLPKHLKLTHYYEYGEKRVFPSQFDWIVNHLEFMRKGE